MKKLIALSIVLFTAFSSFAQTYVSGYTRSNGKYVEPYYRSSPNSTKLDNYSTLGNINPFTGSIGTKTYSDFNNYGNTYSNFNNYSLPSTYPTYSYPSYNTYSIPSYNSYSFPSLNTYSLPTFSSSVYYNSRW